jgi:hypothetical protein
MIACVKKRHNQGRYVKATESQTRNRKIRGRVNVVALVDAQQIVTVETLSY